MFTCVITSNIKTFVHSMNSKAVLIHVLLLLNADKLKHSNIKYFSITTWSLNLVTSYLLLVYFCLYYFSVFLVWVFVDQITTKVTNTWKIKIIYIIALRTLWCTYVVRTHARDLNDRDHLWWHIGVIGLIQFTSAGKNDICISSVRIAFMYLWLALV